MASSSNSLNGLAPYYTSKALKAVPEQCIYSLEMEVINTLEFEIWPLWLSGSIVSDEGYIRSQSAPIVQAVFYAGSAKESGVPTSLILMPLSRT